MKVLQIHVFDEIKVTESPLKVRFVKKVEQKHEDVPLSILDNNMDVLPQKTTLNWAPLMARSPSTVGLAIPLSIAAAYC